MHMDDPGHYHQLQQPSISLLSDSGTTAVSGNAASLFMYHNFNFLSKNNLKVREPNHNKYGVNVKMNCLKAIGCG